MVAYIARRLLHAIPLLFGILTLVFVFMHAAPGDPTGIYMRPGVSPEVLEQMRRNWGLDQPLHIQYVKWLASFSTGDFGVSLAQHRPVSAIIAD
ncbi:MAG: ABC transporter permease, partial [Gammaproteobacteria bacterium]|nr:ABC transporter permease [Gammaproteobacteria bacterium]NIV20335.1 diguanylate cyclase [Gammaproteobacteria bacterium]NIY33113.1 diguanylate cyclase [Gammaproteobacteria bacterium]